MTNTSRDQSNSRHRSVPVSGASAYDGGGCIDCREPKAISRSTTVAQSSILRLVDCALRRLSKTILQSKGRLQSGQTVSSLCTHVILHVRRGEEEQSASLRPVTYKTAVSRTHESQVGPKWIYYSHVRRTGLLVLCSCASCVKALHSRQSWAWQRKSCEPPACIFTRYFLGFIPTIFDLDQASHRMASNMQSL